MYAILDHIGAILVTSVLLIGVFTLQQRYQQRNIEMQVSQMIKKRAHEFGKTIEMDLENMRRQEEVEAVGKTYSCEMVQDASGLTSFLTFPTLGQPDLGANSPIVQVSYQLNALGKTVLVNGMDVPLYMLDRLVDDGISNYSDGSSGEMITHFSVGMYADGPGGPITSLSCPSNLSRIRLEFEAALSPVEFAAGNQRSISNVNAVRYSSTIYSQNFTNR